MRRIACLLAVLLSFFVVTTGADDSDKLLTVDHYVRVKSTVPAMAGQPAQLYVRERVTAGSALRAPSLACSSHNAMWERNHVLLFRASLEWLTQGTVNGTKTGMLKLGYASVPESR